MDLYHASEMSEMSLEEFKELHHRFTAIDPLDPYVFRDDLVEGEDLEEDEWIEDEFAVQPASEEMRELYKQDITFGR